MTLIDFIGNFILGGVISNHAISFAEYISALLVTFVIVSGLNYLMSTSMSTRSLVMGQAYTIIEGDASPQMRSTARTTRLTRSSFWLSCAAWVSSR